jgi:hypothetical protein
LTNIVNNNKNMVLIKNTEKKLVGTTDDAARDFSVVCTILCWRLGCVNNVKARK